MADTIATRVARLIAGGTHALIDKAENLAPDAIMAQSIREIDQVIVEVRVDLGKAEAAKHLLLSQTAKLNDEHEKLSAQIETAVEQQRDDLATIAIGRQTDIEDYLPVLQKSLHEQSEHATECEGYLIALQAKKRELEQLLQDYLASHSSPSDANALNGLNRQLRVEDSEAAFGRVLARQTGIAGLGQQNLQNAAKLKELADIQHNNRVAERLAAVKARNSVKP